MLPAEASDVDAGHIDLLTSTAHQYVLQKKKFNAGSEKCAYRFLRSVDDRLTLHVEPRVQDHLSAGGFPHGLEKDIEFLVVDLRNSLLARRTAEPPA